MEERIDIYKGTYIHNYIWYCISIIIGNLPKL